MRRYLNSPAILISVILFACEEDPIIEKKDLVYAYDFKESLQEWSVGFTDYPLGEEEFYELDSAWVTLPYPLNQTKKSLMIEGNNHSDDLFMFMKRKIKGLDTLTQYSVSFSVEFASNYPESYLGVGGSPGSSVFLKAGVTLEEPIAVKEDGNWRMNIDKGNQAEGGTDMLLLGHIGTNRQDEQYDLIRRNNNEEQSFKMTTDEKGEAWLILGTDSGFEGKTRLYYNRIKVTFTRHEA
ncbi:hypothetical protein OKW21_003382 [Catalinimonas alkaloidigena]|uniref:hypothetical protein n=1 Tax=Catalinimonas alkaloidigena TaxID=1075417 RepID=UPI0024056344|nr:hypothetical protein [Catalinimonas alkaloidigena]MDF9798119.1 hypothetical protein [Catalinimonas alkaloidigena]